MAHSTKLHIFNTK